MIKILFFFLGQEEDRGIGASSGATMRDIISPFVGCHYTGKNKIDFGKLPVKDNGQWPMVCMVSGCSAAFGKGNGPTKVIFSHSHSATTPYINISRLYLLSTFLPRFALALCAYVIVANCEIASRRTLPGSNSLLFTISFFSCFLHVPHSPRCPFAMKD